jgi:hypothetical protein
MKMYALLKYHAMQVYWGSGGIAVCAPELVWMHWQGEKIPTTAGN